MSAAVIIKTRTRHSLSCGNVLELDIYDDPLLLPGHAVAEVELQTIDAHVDLPEWLGREITGESGTSNHALFLSLLEKSGH
jgi:CYTH domain-containing protein